MHKIKLILYAFSWIIKAKIIQILIEDNPSMLAALDIKMREIEMELDKTFGKI